MVDGVDDCGSCMQLVRSCAAPVGSQYPTGVENYEHKDLVLVLHTVLHSLSTSYST